MPDRALRRLLLPCGRELPYELERKRVKNLNLRVRPDGSVHVSAPPAVPLARIEAFLRSREAFLLDALARADQRSRRPGPTHYAEGELLSVWGESVPLRVRPGRGSGAELSGGALWLTVRDPEDEGQRRRAAESWQRRSCEERIGAMCRQVYPAFAARGLPFPTLRYQNMRSRWGVCRPARGELCFSTRLAEVPPACALYVVVHEFSHFFQPNHSRAFYDEVAGILPDWRQRRDLLRQWE